MADSKSIIDFRVSPEIAEDRETLKKAIQDHLRREKISIDGFKILSRSIDARKRTIIIQFRILIWSGETPPETTHHIRRFMSVHEQPTVAIVGSGPAGLFAALKLIELGIKPIVFERGKDVRQRRRDLAAINKDQIVNPESNYCFGEGGAGTYSDGKLYTRSKKRGDVRSVLETFIQFGTDPDILVNAHPHIGTNKLPQIIVAMREAIIANGGEVRFNSKLTDLIIENGRIRGIEINQKKKLKFDHLILATGHSARDIFRLLHQKGVEIEAKPFALGVRIEHPQLLIDQIQYHCDTRPESLPPAAYNWTAQVQGRGVYSFCMCPGGIIAPCATEQDQVVTNGWSPSKRNNLFANSGVVVTVDERDWKNFSSAGPLAAMEFQASVEHKAWIAGGKTQHAPAQRLTDFLQKKISTDLPKSSYQPGIVSADLNTILPEKVADLLREGFREAIRKMPKYLSQDAVLVGVESRTSSPVRIPRDPETLQHISIRGLYPSGEGAGYAGGIVSAAIDGEKCAARCAAIIELASANK